MMMEPIQMTITTVFFAVLGAATTYRWIGTTGRVREYSRQRIVILTLFTAVATAVFWVLLGIGLDRMPERLAELVPVVILIGLALFSRWKPVRTSVAERESTRRIQVAILIGGAILTAFCLIVFWPK
jgi:hypothetical protein